VDSSPPGTTKTTGWPSYFAPVCVIALLGADRQNKFILSINYSLRVENVVYGSLRKTLTSKFLDVHILTLFAVTIYLQHTDVVLC